jgi:hypothetical protein
LFLPRPKVNLHVCRMLWQVLRVRWNDAQPGHLSTRHLLKRLRQIAALGRALATCYLGSLEIEDISDLLCSRRHDVQDTGMQSNLAALGGHFLQRLDCRNRAIDFRVTRAAYQLHRWCSVVTDSLRTCMLCLSHQRKLAYRLLACHSCQPRCRAAARTDGLVQIGLIVKPNLENPGLRKGHSPFVAVSEAHHRTMCERLVVGLSITSLCF